MHTSVYRQDYFKDRLWDTAPKKIIDDVIDELQFLSRERLHKDLSEITILDVGCGAGEYSIALSKIAKKVVGIEPFKNAYQSALRRKKGISLRLFLLMTLLKTLRLNKNLI